MKNVKILFGIALVVAIMFVSCGDPEEGDYTVTFMDKYGGQILETQTVASGGYATDPNATRSFTPTNAGLFKAYETVKEWRLNEGSEVFDFNTAITKDTTLVAKTWDSASSLASTVPLAVTYIKNNPGDYIYGVNSESIGAQDLDKGTFSLTILGLSTGGNITLTGAGPLFKLGEATPATTTSASKKESTAKLILKNVTLTGNNSSNNAVVHVLNAASLTMEAGSKITGNSSSGAGTGSGARGAAVFIEMGDFIMKAGEVTGNTSTYSSTKGFAIAGVYAFDYAFLDLQGGKIASNTSGGTDDVYVQGTSRVRLSGTAEVGDLTLGVNTGETLTSHVSVITSGTDYSVKTLNLRSNGTAVSALKTYWTAAGGRIILQAESGDITAADIACFGLGGFILDNGTKVSIDEQGLKISLNAEGKGVLGNKS